jgi:hypothetical protein
MTGIHSEKCVHCRGNIIGCKYAPLSLGNIVLRDYYHLWGLSFVEPSFYSTHLHYTSQSVPIYTLTLCSSKTSVWIAQPIQKVMRAFLFSLGLFWWVMEAHRRNGPMAHLTQEDASKMASCFYSWGDGCGGCCLSQHPVEPAAVLWFPSYWLTLWK